MNRFHLDGPAATPLLPGPTLLEASAGTGKTYTIAGLVVRLVLEHDLPLERIAVMTFTRAATAELRDRIRASLAEAARALDDADATGFPGWIRACHQALDAPTAAAWRRRLRRALDAVDAAGIATIHAFVGAVAKDHAAQVGIDPAAPVTVDLGGWRSETVRDWFRRHLRDGDPRWPALLGSNPLKALEQVAKDTEHAPLARLATAPIPPAAMAEHLESLARAWVPHRAKLLAHAGQYLAKYRKGGVLHPDSIALRLELADAWLREGQAPKGAEKLADLWSDKQLPNLDKYPGADPALFRAIPGFLPTNLAGGLLAAFAADYLDRLQQRPATVRELATGDFILALDQALDERRGEAADLLARRIGDRCDAVLVDEFQDTDLVQWRILRRCFTAAHHRLLLIGDPKQAIYAFRGADVYAYGAARNTVPASRQFTLDTNHRSDAPLIAALNGLYAGGGRLPALADPFAVHGVAYHPVQAAKPRRIAGGVLDPRPLQVWTLEPVANLEEAQARVNALVVAEIARLLDPATGVLLGDPGRPCQPGDIAVLVRNHHQADALHGALAAAGIPAVRQDRVSVFSTPAAEELHALLAACLDPSRETIIRSAAATHLVGVTAEALAAGDPRLEALPLVLGHLAEVWLREGIAAWWYQTADTDLGWGTPRLRLAGLGDHGRMAMDVLHLVELLAKAAGEQALPAPGLLEWLEQHRAGASDENDDAQRRLERDDPAVRLVTVHASKGLQYPIVFEAFAWIPAKLSDHGGLVHPGDGIDADRHLGEWPEDVLPQAQREVLGDDLRKLYVGLTRAMHRLYVLWVPVASVTRPSALAWLLAGRTAPDAATMSLAVAADGGASVDDPFTRLKHRTALGVDLPDLPEVAVVAIPAEQAVETSPRPPAPAPTEHPTDPRPTLDLERILRRWQRSSFTGLARFAEREETQDGLDHDAAATPAAGATDVDEAPGGAALGSLVHRLYEHGDFPRWRSEPGHLAPLLRSHAAQDGVLLTEPQIARLAQHCRATVVEPVPALGLALADLPARAVAREWPIRLGIPRPSPGLGRLLAGHVPEAPAWPATLGPAVIPAGVFTGVLDALVHVDGRYHVIDWKTNRLPGYAPADLVQAMADEHYFLQAHLYLLAVHRFLRFRRPDYDPARHLGGAHYAFLRGSDAPGGGWFTVAARPDLLEACDAAF